MSPWWPFLGILSWWPIFKSSHCYSFEDGIRFHHRAVSKFASSQWEMALLCNDVSHWLGTGLDLIFDVSCSDLTTWEGTRLVVPVMAAKQHALLTHWPLVLALLIGIFRSSHDNALRWMTQDLADDKSSLVQVMAWCHQATSHYLSQCWLSSLSPYGIAGPQWVNGYDIESVRKEWYNSHYCVVLKTLPLIIIAVWYNLVKQGMSPWWSLVRLLNGHPLI